MPELPEVETTRAQIERVLAGRRIELEIRDPSLAGERSAEIAGRVKGTRVMRVLRKGKYLLLELDSGDTVVVHLRMTGRFQVEDSLEHEPRYVRALFTIEGCKLLFLVDVRRLGEMFIIDRDEAETCKRLSRLGPDPLSDAFTVDVLRQRLSSRSSSIKQVLMNQQVIAGVGNIYAQESLHRAGIHPERRASQLDAGELARVHQSLRHVLMDALSCGGSSINTYRTPSGDVGQFAERFAVYGRAGKSCPRCGGTIQRRKIGGRGTYFCQTCQT